MAERRRRYTQGRSRTIELSTLVEMDEDGTLKSERSRSRISQDDSCIRTPVKGNVKEIARHLSERHAQQRAKKELHRSESARSSRMDTETPKIDEKEKQRVKMDESGTVRVRKDNDVIKKFDENSRIRMRHFVPRESASRVQRSQSERRHRTPNEANTPSDWPEFHQVPACSVPRLPLSRSASFVAPTPVFLYSMAPDRLQYGLPADRLSLVDPRDGRLPLGEYALPLYYTMPPPPPTPLYLHQGPTMMRPPTKLAQLDFTNPASVAPQQKTFCSQICCGGLAQLLWSIICVVMFGVIASLILALCYI